MNKLTKIGVTALAGSLMSLSVSAGEMAVTGTAEVTYTTGESGTTTNGNPWGAKNNIGFKGSGDVNGFAVSYGTVMNDAMSGASSSLLTVDMGALGLVGIDNGTGSFGTDTADDSILPTAYEEVSHGGGSGSLGISGSSNVLGYKNTFMGVSVNAEYNSDFSGERNGDGVSSGTGPADVASTSANELFEATTQGSSFNYVLSYEVMDGLTLGGGFGETATVATTAAADQNSEENTVYAKYSTGPISVGYFQNEYQKGNTVGADGRKTDGYSIAYAVNENLSVSYSARDVEFDDGDDNNTSEESQALMGSYTMGGASLRLAHNEHSNPGGNSLLNEVKATEISLVLAF
jgi:outer membrane protein OmpU